MGGLWSVLDSEKRQNIRGWIVGGVCGSIPGDGWSSSGQVDIDRESESGSVSV